MTITDYCERINNAFPVFSYGEGYIVETLGKFPFDHEGMKRLADWYERLSTKVLEFLKEFPELGQRERSIICDYQMSHIRAKITRVHSEFDCYCKIEQRLTSEPWRSIIQQLTSEHMTA